MTASHEAQLPIWMSREPSDLNWLHPDSPPWHAVKNPSECLFRMVGIYYLLNIYCIFCIPTWEILFLSLVQSNLSVLMIISVTFQFSRIDWLFSNQYPIIVWLMFSILILEMYSRYFDPVINNPSTESINIIQVQDSKLCIFSRFYTYFVIRYSSRLRPELGPTLLSGNSCAWSARGKGGGMTRWKSKPGLDINSHRESI